MTWNVVNSNFSEISYIEYLEGTQVISSYRRSSTSSLSGIDFLETNFKFIQEKIKFNDIVPLVYLDSSDRSIVDVSSESIEKYLVTLFPSSLKTGTRKVSEGYFSTLISPPSELLAIDIPEKISQVKMYENESDTKPSLIINLQNEASDRKVLYIIFQYTKDSPVTVNLSYTSWVSDKNGNKKMSDYVLRNDSIQTVYPAVRENKLGYKFSEASGSLIGMTKLGGRPIYNLRKTRANDIWSPDKMYKMGETVTLGGSIRYKSLIPGNLGNHPYYSRCWVKSDVI